MIKFIAGVLVGLACACTYAAIPVDVKASMTCWHKQLFDPVFSGRIEILGIILEAPGVDLTGKYSLCGDNNIQCDVDLDSE